MQVLLDEDDGDLRTMYARYLQARGYAVLEAADGEEALAAFEEHRPGAVISDVLLPGMMGFDLCARIRELAPEAPLIMMTAVYHHPNYARDAADRLGVDHYLNKPFPLEKLLAPGARRQPRASGQSEAQASARAHPAQQA